MEDEKRVVFFFFFFKEAEKNQDSYLFNYYIIKFIICKKYLLEGTTVFYIKIDGFDEFLHSWMDLNWWL